MSRDLIISVLNILVIFILAVFGGIVSVQSRLYRWIFVALGGVGLVFGVAQAVRQQQSEGVFEARVRELREETEKVQQLQAENDKKQGEIKEKTEENIRLSNKITQLAETAISTSTGGNSFCYLRMLVRSDGIYPVVLSKGRYPLYDLHLRVWDPEEWKTSPRSLNSLLTKVAEETTRLGTLPSRDYINLGRMPLPVGAEKQYAAEFSARNGSWFQSILLRRSRDSWKVATIVQRSIRAGTLKELNQSRPILCHEADPDFPEREAGELRRRAGNARPCREM